MAAKSKILRLLRENSNSGPAPVRRQPAKPSGLYLLELRSHSSPAELPKRKLAVTIELQPGDESFPKSIKIKHA